MAGSRDAVSLALCSSEAFRENYTVSWRHPERSRFSSGAQDLHNTYVARAREIPRRAGENAGLRDDAFCFAGSEQPILPNAGEAFPRLTRLKSA